MTKFTNLYVYIYDADDNLTKINLDALINYPTYYAYIVENNEEKPTKLLISDLQSKTSDYIMYAFDKKGKTTYSVDKSRVLDSPWEDRMIRSYIDRHPEQAMWFKMITVDNIVKRDTLQYNAHFAPESWVHVKNDGTGKSKDYILSADRRFWVDPMIVGLDEPSGLIVKNELYNRLSSGYLYDTFGPTGQNRTECDFVYAVYADNRFGDISAATWTKTGDTLRWDFGGGTVVDSTNMPTHTMVDGEHTVTVSSTDGFSNVSKYEFSDSAIGGAIPRLDFTSVNNISDLFRHCRFSGPLPPFDFSNSVDADYFCMYSLITSAPDLNFDSLTGDVWDMFSRTKVSNKIGTLSFPNVDKVQGLFWSTPISTLNLDINIRDTATAPVATGNSINIPKSEFVKLFRSPKYKKLRDFFFNKENEDNNPSEPNYDRIMAVNVENLNILKNLHINDVKLYRYLMIRYAGIVFANDIRHIPAFTIDDVPDSYVFSGINTNPIGEFKFSKLDNVSVSNLLSFMYDRRLLNKQNSTKDITFNLQSYKKLDGEYKNTKKPRLANEFLYKLIENPDSEDINNYSAFYNQDGTVDQQTYTEMVVDVASPSKVKFHIPILYSIYKNGAIEIDWGDGNSSAINVDAGTYVYGVMADHEYSSAGTYTVKWTTPKNNRSVLDGYATDFAFTSFSGDQFTIREATFNSDHVITTYRMFRDLSGLEKIHFNADRNNKPIFSRLFETFRNCPSLTHIDPIYISQPDVQATKLFKDTGNIESVVLNGMNNTFSIANNQLDDAALNALFEGLADMTGNPKTITVTGNPGVGTGVYDTTIATDKGWTVVDA